MPAVRRGAGSSGVDRRAVAGPGPDAAARRRHAAGQQRRRRQELRHGRARQADPHVRRRGRRTTAGSSCAARTPGSGSRRWTTSTATLDPETLAHRRPERPDRDRRGHGRRRVRGRPTRRRDVIVESAIFDPVSIRRTAFRYALRSEASLRFEKGQELRLARLGADRAAQLVGDWAGGARGAGARRHDPGRARAAGACRVPAGARQPPPRHGHARPTSSATCSARRHRDGAGPAGHGVSPSPRGPQPLETVGRRRARRCWRRSHVAARPAHRGGRGRGGRPGPRLRASMPGTLPRHADAALPAVAAGGARRDPRDARRRRHQRSRDLRPRRRRRCRGASDRSTTPAVPGEGAATGRTSDRQESAVEPTTRCCARASSGASSRSSDTNRATGRMTSRCSRSGRATASRTASGHASGGASGSRWPAPPMPPVGTGRRERRPRRRQGPCRAALPAVSADSPTYGPLTDDPNLHPGRAVRITIDGAAERSRPGGSSIRRGRRPGPAGPRVVVAELAIVGLSGGSARAGPRRDAAAPSRPSSATSRSSSPDRPAADVGPPSAATWRRAARALLRCSTSIAAGRSSRHRAEPGLAAAVRRRRSHARPRPRSTPRSRPSRWTGRRCRRPYSRLSGTFGPVAAADWPLLPLRGFGARHSRAPLR